MGKLRPHMWPDELLNAARRPFTIISPVTQSPFQWSHFMTWPLHNAVSTMFDIDCDHFSPHKAKTIIHRNKVLKHFTVEERQERLQAPEIKSSNWGCLLCYFAPDQELRCQVWILAQWTKLSGYLKGHYEDRIKKFPWEGMMKKRRVQNTASNRAC